MRTVEAQTVQQTEQVVGVGPGLRAGRLDRGSTR